MRVIDPGHLYALKRLDTRLPGLDAYLGFVKRIGPEYPGNEGVPKAGVTSQEVMRALIDRTKYVDNQEKHSANLVVLELLRSCIYVLEKRAAEKHGRLDEFIKLTRLSPMDIENQPTCSRCGHIGCDGNYCKERLSV
jgi:hypothetical protein